MIVRPVIILIPLTATAVVGAGVVGFAATLITILVIVDFRGRCLRMDRERQNNVNTGSPAVVHRLDI
ncbi:hypothetical protein RX327_30520 [Bradyrhizobium sp. BEA-2-5]|uniref:hypothetical protein n=1 Tax=Bradyrhizobium sp. BEA-2-5 TaxID=3080015 RepID=UPI00293F4D29|nr:hypothetical protein [Bradyrhizobium sp. BEA-2-5]WOH80136.1 hypothetical protein RX327_30520 [Bradyrhizobium sp. BEA-2-5]